MRNGHGLTIGSEASGGMSNITYKDIFLNGKGGPQAPGLRKRPGAVGGIHFKTGRGRGGLWTDISYVNIYGNFATGLVGFSENHGSGYNQKLGPTNATGTPQIRNLLVKVHKDRCCRCCVQLNTFLKSFLQLIVLFS